MTNDQIKFWKNVKIKSFIECWEYKSKQSSGYGNWFQYKGIRYYPHRLAYIFANPNEDITNMQIQHSCDNPLCCNPNHLSVGTHQDNMNDKIQRKRHLYEDGRGRASKLTPDQARKIKRSYATGNYTQIFLSILYDVHVSAIRRILNHKN